MSPSEALHRVRINGIVSAVIAEIEAKIGDSVTSYTTSLPPAGSFAEKEGKAIKDSVWGMIHFSADETAIIDSPRLQRLRGVRQLGVTYLTYPTAGYSRFEHTLGVVHQCDKMWRAIRQRTSRDLWSSLEDSDLRALRLAALVHDVGHMPFSHLSERFFDETEHVSEAIANKWKGVIQAFRTEIGAPHVSMGEMLSVLTALTPSMGELFRRVDYQEEAVANACLLILGLGESSQKAYLGQMLSNIIDADKLDYMFRDALVTGVPLAIDLERLLFKLKVVQLEANAAPEQVVTRLKNFFQLGDGTGAKINVLATDLTGRRHFHELMIARVLLHDRVYFHHKTRAAERFFLSYLKEINLSPTDLLSMDDGELLAMDLNQGTRPAAASIRLRLKTRELPKRCFAFTGRFLIAARRAVYPLEFFGSPQTQESISPKSETPDSPLEGSTNAESETQEQRNGILRLKRDSRSFEKRQLLCERIVATYKRIASLLDGTSESEIPSPEVYLDRERSLQPPNDNLVVLHPDLTINEENFPYLASAFPQLLPLSFVFASNLGPSEEIKDRSFAACEWTIAKDYGLAFGDEAAHYAKRNWKALAKLRHRIEEADPSFYNGLWSLRCFSESLEKTVNTVAVKRLGEKFAIYLAETNTSKINSRRVHFFLSQFPDDLVEPMLEVLNQVKIFQPEEYRGFFDGFSQQDCIFAPLELQAQAKSGGLMSYYAPPELQGRVKTFEDALSQGEQPIVFFEESVLSGSQTADIISQWQGKPSRENLSRELTPDEVQMLRRRCNGKLHLLFMFGLQAGVERLKHEASEFGFEVDVELAFDLADLGGPFDSGDFPKKAELREFLERVGESLLRSTKLPDSTGKWSEELILNRRFGYGNRGAVVLTPFNCPTSSITALWKRGIFQGKSWMPLFVRRQEPPFPNWDLFNQSQPAR